MKRPSYLVPHVAGATAIGGLEAMRLKSVAVALAVVPVFAVTGLVIGAVLAAAARVASGRAWWQRALIMALPSLVVTIPVGRTLFDGAHAQTLPLAGVMPVVVPLLSWLALAAIASAAYRWPAPATSAPVTSERKRERMERARVANDLMVRGSLVMGLALVLGGIVWFERNVLRTGYPDAHVGATIAVLVLAGFAVRVAWPIAASRRAVGIVAAAVAVAAIVAAGWGLADARDRQLVDTYGDQGRDLARLWRGIVDLDRDGSSPILGGGDCDDLDRDRHPGAADTPGDGIDQDCDGEDAPVLAPPRGEVKVPAEVARSEALVARTKGMNIVVLSVDALRLDLLQPGAAGREDFPRIARLLDESVWFEHAIAPASSTDVSLCALLTGRLNPYEDIETTLPEALTAAGYRTSSAIPLEVTRYVGDVMIGRGIDHPTPIRTDAGVEDIGDHVSAGETTAAGMRALADAAGTPSFVWLHYFDVHEHHQIEVATSLLAQVHDASPGPQGLRYRALLHAIDGEVGKVLDRIDAAKTIVVFVGDHGENLDDPRAPETHGKVTYGPLVRIPFAIRVPGIAGMRREDAVTLADIAPTLATLVGVSLPTDGHDLTGALVGGATLARPIVIHEEDQWSVVEWPYQLIVTPATNLAELYDLDRDPGEHHDVAAEHPDVMQRLKAAYAAAPRVTVDRTPAGRAWREDRARPPARRAPP